MIDADLFQSCAALIDDKLKKKNSNLRRPPRFLDFFKV